MENVDIVVVKGFFNERYRDNATCIAFDIYVTVINIQESY